MPSIDDDILAAALALTAPAEAPPPYISPMERALLRYVRDLNDVMPGKGYYHVPVNVANVVVETLLAQLPLAQAEQALTTSPEACVAALRELLSAIMRHTPPPAS